MAIRSAHELFIDGFIQEISNHAVYMDESGQWTQASAHSRLFRYMISWIPFSRYFVDSTVDRCNKLTREWFNAQVFNNNSLERRCSDSRYYIGIGSQSNLFAAGTGNDYTRQVFERALRTIFMDYNHNNGYLDNSLAAAKATERDAQEAYYKAIMGAQTHAHGQKLLGYQTSLAAVARKVAELAKKLPATTPPATTAVDGGSGDTTHVAANKVKLAEAGLARLGAGPKEEDAVAKQIADLTKQLTDSVTGLDLLMASAGADEADVKEGRAAKAMNEQNVVKLAEAENKIRKLEAAIEAAKKEIQSSWSDKARELNDAAAKEKDEAIGKLNAAHNSVVTEMNKAKKEEIAKIRESFERTIAASQADTKLAAEKLSSAEEARKIAQSLAQTLQKQLDSAREENVRLTRNALSGSGVLVNSGGLSSSVAAFGGAAPAAAAGTAPSVGLLFPPPPDVLSPLPASTTPPAPPTAEHASAVAAERLPPPMSPLPPATTPPPPSTPVRPVVTTIDRVPSGGDGETPSVDRSRMEESSTAMPARAPYDVVPVLLSPVGTPPPPSAHSALGAPPNANGTRAATTSAAAAAAIPTSPPR